MSGIAQIAIPFIKRKLMILWKRLGTVPANKNVVRRDKSVTVVSFQTSDGVHSARLKTGPNQKPVNWKDRRGNPLITELNVTYEILCHCLDFMTSQEIQ